MTCAYCGHDWAGLRKLHGTTVCGRASCQLAALRSYALAVGSVDLLAWSRTIETHRLTYAEWRERRAA